MVHNVNLDKSPISLILSSSNIGLLDYLSLGKLKGTPTTSRTAVQLQDGQGEEKLKWDMTWVSVTLILPVFQK